MHLDSQAKMITLTLDHQSEFFSFTMRRRDLWEEAISSPKNWPSIPPSEQKLGFNFIRTNVNRPWCGLGNIRKELSQF